MADIIDFDHYRRTNLGNRSHANDNDPHAYPCRFWTDDHRELAYVIVDGTAIWKEHPVPIGFS